MPLINAIKDSELFRVVHRQMADFCSLNLLGSFLSAGGDVSQRLSNHVPIYKISLT